MQESLEPFCGAGVNVFVHVSFFREESLAEERMPNKPLQRTWTVNIKKRTLTPQSTLKWLPIAPSLLG
jgi:hypothetical protein